MKLKVVTESNLKLAFHHFDVDNLTSNSGLNLSKAFKRQGKNYSDEDVEAMIGFFNWASGTHRKGKVKYSEFKIVLLGILD